MSDQEVRAHAATVSEYRVEKCYALAYSSCWRVMDSTGHIVGHSRNQADAERIAKALALLDKQERP